METIDERQRTYEHLKKNLSVYGKSALVRGTGFGKSFMLVRLCGEYQKVLFLYPGKKLKTEMMKNYCTLNNLGLSNVDYKSDSIGNITFMSYMKLIRLSNFKFDCDLIIADECHRIGATRTKTALTNLLNNNKKAHFVAASATPNRMDAFDVVDRFCDNVNVYEYTLHDAFKDGLLQKPYYVFCTHNMKDKVSSDVKKEIQKQPHELTNAEVKTLDKKIIEIANLYNIENIIRSGVNEVRPGDNYFKFICFFNDFNHIEDKSKGVKKWFKKAFPNFKINVLVITSQNKETFDNANKLNSLKRKANTIDLIFAIDMLNMGYHLKDLTGILMYRCTYSDIVYIQQLGRALSSGSSKPCIVFDIVDNIDRHSLFDSYDRDTVISITQRHKMEAISNGTYSDTYEVTTNEGDVIRIPNNQYYDRETGNIRNKWWRDCNVLEPTDFISTGYEAEYKKLIKKVVAEPMLQRCKMAFANHFRFWCNEHNLPFPITDKELREVYGYSRDEFNKYFYDLVKENKFDYPLGDAELLKQNGLDLIAKIWNLTTDKIVEALM